MQSAEDEVSRLRRRHGDPDRLEVAQLADQNDVGVLAKGVFQSVLERQRIAGRPDLSLGDIRFFGFMQIFDGVFDGNDMVAAGAVDGVDQGGQGGGLAASGRPGDQHQPVFRERERFDRLRQPQILQAGNLGGQGPEAPGHRAALFVDVAAEAPQPGDAISEVQLIAGFFIVLEAFALFLGQDAVYQRLGGFGSQPLEIGQDDEPAIDADGRVEPGHQVQIRAFGLDELMEKFEKIHGRAPGWEDRRTASGKARRRADSQFKARALAPSKPGWMQSGSYKAG